MYTQHIKILWKCKDIINIQSTTADATSRNSRTISTVGINILLYCISYRIINDARIKGSKTSFIRKELRNNKEGHHIPPSCIMSYEVITAKKTEMYILENIMKKKKIPQKLLEACEWRTKNSETRKLKDGCVRGWDILLVTQSVLRADQSLCCNSLMIWLLKDYYRFNSL